MWCLIISVLAALLLINAAIGHGTWLLLVAIFRRKPKTCPRCNGVLSGSRCSSCLWPERIDPGGIAEREIMRLWKKGAIEPEVFDQVVRAIAAERQFRSPPVIPMATLARAEVSETGSVSDPPRASQFIPVVHPPALPEAAQSSEGPAAPVASFPEVAPLSPPETIPEPVRLEPARSEPIPEPPAPEPPRAPHKPMAQIMASFMEARNIRWGELIGGLLIVGCSVALVVSLWSRIADQPVLKFLIFDLVTAALFGLGLYSQHRWKLPLTSRGILVTATLMVPLASLASVAFSEGSAASNSIAIVSQAVSLLVFAVLLWQSSRVIAAHWPALLTAIVLGSSLVLLLVRYVSPGAAGMPAGRLVLLAAAPLAGYEIVMIAALWRARRWPDFGTIECRAILLILGIASFSISVPLGLLIYKAGVSLSTFRALAPLTALAGWPALGVGLLLWQRLASTSLGALRTGGTATAVFGAGMLVAGMVLSWPAPAEIMPVALIDCLTLAAVAALFEIPAAILPAGLCLAWAYLIGLHLGAGRISWHADTDQMVRALLSGTTAIGLIPLLVLIAVVAEMLSRRGRKEDGRFTLIVAAICAAASIALVTRNAYFVSAGSRVSAYVYAFYAAAAMYAALRFRRPWVTWLGWILLLPAIQQSPFLAQTTLDSWSLALLIEATAVAIIALLCRRRGGRFAQTFAGSARATALVGSVLAILPLAMMQPSPGCDLVAGRLLWISLISGVFWLLESSPGYFALFQFLLTGAAAFSVAGRLLRLGWFAHSDNPLSDPRTIQPYALVFAAMGLGWGVLRLIFRKNQRLVLGTTWSVDRTFTAIATVLLWTLAVMSVLPGISAEFSSSPLATGSHVLSSGRESWALLVILAAAVLAEIPARPSVLLLQVFAAVLFCVCPFLAARWEGQTAVASALRWSAAVYLVLGMTPVWARGKLSVVSRVDDNAMIRTGRFILLLAGGLVLLLSVYPSWLAASGTPPRGPAVGSFFAHIGNSISYLVPLACVMATLIGCAVRERSPIYAFGASLVLNLAATLGYLLAHVGAPFDADQAAKLLQLNTAAFASFALGWMLVLRTASKGEKDPLIPRLLMVQVWLAAAGLFAWIVPTDLCFLFSPGRFILPADLGGIFGWIAAITTGAAFLTLTLFTRPRLAINLVSSGLLVLATMVAITVALLGGSGWDAYHTLLSAHVAVAWAVLGIGCLLSRRQSEELPLSSGPVLSSSNSEATAVISLEYQRPTDASADSGRDEADRANASRWIAGVGCLVVIMALRIVWQDPNRPWWSAGAILFMSLLAAAAACWRLARQYIYAAGCLFNLAITLWWFHAYGQWGTSSLADLANVNVIALTLPAIAWLVLELEVFRPRPATIATVRPFHSTAALVSTMLVVLLVALGLRADAIGDPFHLTVWIAWGAMASTAALLISCLWDAEMTSVLPALYLLGLAAVGLAVNQFHLHVNDLASRGAIILSAYGLATSALYYFRDRGQSLMAST